jgi:nicotinamidase/pyrazinamidase
VFLKGTDPQIDSYSAFYDNAHQRSTGLGDYLRSMDAGEVYIAGLATEYSVKFSALDAMDLGFKTTVVEDACRGVNIAPGDHLDALERMRSRGVEIIRSSQILQDVQGP